MIDKEKALSILNLMYMSTESISVKEAVKYAIDKLEHNMKPSSVNSSKRELTLKERMNIAIFIITSINRTYNLFGISYTVLNLKNRYSVPKGEGILDFMFNYICYNRRNDDIRGYRHWRGGNVYFDKFYCYLKDYEVSNKECDAPEFCKGCKWFSKEGILITSDNEDDECKVGDIVTNFYCKKNCYHFQLDKCETPNKDALDEYVRKQKNEWEKRRRDIIKRLQPYRVFAKRVILKLDGFLSWIDNETFNTLIQVLNTPSNSRNAGLWKNVFAITADLIVIKYLEYDNTIAKAISKYYKE
jgi:hypothetical protein